MAEKVAVDLEGIADRTIRLTPNSSALADMYLTPDGETLYYITSFENGYDLWKAKPRSFLRNCIRTGRSWLSMQI